MLEDIGMTKSDLPFPVEIMRGLTDVHIGTHSHLVARFGDRESRVWNQNPYQLVVRDYWRINMLFLQLRGKDSTKAEDIRSSMRDLGGKGAEQASLLLLAGRAWLSELGKLHHTDNVLFVRERLEEMQKYTDEMLLTLSDLKDMSREVRDLDEDPAFLYATMLCGPYPVGEWRVSPVDRFMWAVESALAGVKVAFERETEALKGSQALGGGVSPLTHAAYAEIVSEIAHTRGNYGSSQDATGLFHKWGIELTPRAQKAWRRREEREKAKAKKGHTE
jgi:hypothetical protein